MITEEVLESFSGKNILVTGGTGLIGRQVVDILCSAEANVVSVSLDEIEINPKATRILGDVTSFEFCKEITTDRDFAFHLAGVQGTVLTTFTKLASHFVPMLMMNTNVLEACRLNKVQKVLFTSTIGAYAEAAVLKESEYRHDSEPMSFAGWAKRVAEMQIFAYKKQYNLHGYSVVRPSNVYGPGDNFDTETGLVVASLISRIVQGEDPVMVWGDGSAVRDFVFSKDVAEGLILALYHGVPSGFVNLGSGKGHSIRELVETLHSFIDFNCEFDETKPTGSQIRIMDISLARELIGYNPRTSFLDGLKETYDWYVRNPDEHLKKMNYFVNEKWAK